MLRILPKKDIKYRSFNELATGLTKNVLNELPVEQKSTSHTLNDHRSDTKTRKNTFHSPVEVDSFLCELPLAVRRVFIRFILDDLHPFPSIALLVAVFTDHVQLPNPVLEK